MNSHAELVFRFLHLLCEGHNLCVSPLSAMRTLLLSVSQPVLPELLPIIALLLCSAMRSGHGNWLHALLQAGSSDGE